MEKRYLIIVSVNVGLFEDEVKTNEYSFDSFAEAAKKYSEECSMKHHRNVLFIDTENNEIIRQYYSYNNTKDPKDVNVSIR